MEIAGVSRVFYHYAPFIISAAFESVSGMSGLALSTSLLLPLGLLIAAIGVYTFASELGGRASGLITLTALTCIPASSLIIQSGWFDFYWLLLIAPGSGYAIGVSAVACTSTVAYLDKENLRKLFLILILLGSLIFIRAHMFLLLAPTIVAVMLLHRYHVKISLVSGIAAGIATLTFLTLQFSDFARIMWIKYTDANSYLITAVGTSVSYGKSINITSDLSFGPALLMQVTIIVIAVLGINIIAYPPLLWLNARRNGFKMSDAIPLVLVICFIALNIFSPIAANGDSSEYKHRHFILLYVVFSIYTIHYGICFARERALYLTYSGIYGYGFIILFVSATAFNSWKSNPARPDIKSLPWAADFHDQHITAGLLEVTQYLQSNSNAGDVLTMGLSSVSSSAPQSQIVQIISLTGIPAFLSRSDLKMLGSQCVKTIVSIRLNILKDLLLIDDWSAARTLLRANGIRWYISATDEEPKWDTYSNEAVFSFSGFSVYDAGASSEKTSKPIKC